jgi:RimJ/RimL family protein N-acetyltransferase
VTELQTDRLTLRPHGLADFEECAAMWGDPAVTRHIGGVPFARSDVWARLLRYAGHWTLQGFGFWAVRERETGVFVGDVGCMEFRRELEPALEYPECGWVLAAAAHGKGYATEAVRAVMAWADTQFARTNCIIDVDNEPSLRVAAKCGYLRIRDGVLGNTPVVVFERARAG